MRKQLKIFLRELDTKAYLEWCFKSSPDPYEVVECFQEMLPICRFDEECRNTIKDYLEKHNLKMDMDTGEVPFEFQKRESKQLKYKKPLVEQYLDYIQIVKKSV